VSARQLITEHLDLWTGAVTKKSSSGRGTNGKVELTGVKKLRELILNLAVRGKLVPQNSEEPSAASLLVDIEAKKKDLHHAKTIKKPKKVSPPQGDEIPWTLPSCWEWVRLPDIYYPISPSGKKLKSSETLETGQFPVVDQGQSYISGYTDDASLVIEIPHPVIVFGDHTTARKYIDCNFVPGADGTKILCPILVNPRFFHLQLLGYDLENRGYARHFKVLNENFFALPPLEEQHRIVQKVDELMALCDQLEQQTSDQIQAHETLVDTLLGTLTQSENATQLADNWARLAAHFDTLFTTEQSIDKLKQTILQLAVMGRLVEQDEGDEPAEKILGQLAEVKQAMIAKGLLKKERKSQSVDGVDAPYEIPECWSWCSLTDIGELARGKSKHRPRNDPSLYQDGTVPLIQTGDVAHASPWITTFSAKYNQRGVEQSRLWRPGTLCITIAANIGDTGLLSFDACFPDSVVGFTPFWSDIPPEYFEYFLRTAKQHLEDFAPSTAQKNINLEVLQKLLVPLPPVPEMKRIVQKVDELMALCDQLKERLNQSNETRCQLAEAVVEGALN